jgi:plasmid stability protein
MHVRHANCMAKMVQVRNVPDRLHAILRARAAKAGMSLSEFLLGELRALAERPSLDEILERISHRESVQPRESPAHAIRAEPDAR